MEHLREICKCLKTLVNFLLCHCDSLLKHDPKPWDPPFDLSQPKLDPPLAVAVAVFLFVVTALSSLSFCLLPVGFHVTDLSGRETLVRITVDISKQHEHHFSTGGMPLRDISRETHEAIAIAMDLLGGKSNSGEGALGLENGDTATSAIEHVISYIRILYAFTNDTLAKYSYATSLQATVRYRIPISLVQGLGLDFTFGLTICCCALQLWVGRFLISNGKANGGEIITTLFVVILSSLGLNQVAINFNSFEQGRIAAYKLFEMISCSNSSLNQDGSTLATMQGNIESRNVYFSYLSRPEILILSGFYQNVPARKTVSLVGRNDSRKSSIIPLMERFYDLTLGEIEEAAKTIHAHDFITSLEMGYETQVGRTGLSLTEEQKIKISIARVVLSNPSILLLDEVTSGLDFEAEKVVQEALDILMLGRSTIIIARCLSLILLYI
ncbi:hypothetical protein ZIOFF_039159 [Zingiber officinale]|uniref:ABC transmembrane type-1 domain-containing protein n=1 Tax=Zingiber officinale TaxID=94328 RepID=A0A8J5G417_ZINOF|nr:hypothetical protein ZIOFF_039159 [Zingiber officinale]